MDGPWKSCWLSGFKVMAEFFWGFYVKISRDVKEGDSTNMVHLLPVLTRLLDVFLKVQKIERIRPACWKSSWKFSGRPWDPWLDEFWKNMAFLWSKWQKITTSQFLFPLGVERKKTHQQHWLSVNLDISENSRTGTQKIWWEGAPDRIPL